MLIENKLDQSQSRDSGCEPSRPNTGTSSLAERRARSLAPTIFCPAAHIEHCVRQAQARF